MSGYLRCAERVTTYHSHGKAGSTASCYSNTSPQGGASSAHRCHDKLSQILPPAHREASHSQHITLAVLYRHAMCSLRATINCTRCTRGARGLACPGQIVSMLRRTIGQHRRCWCMHAAAPAPPTGLHVELTRCHAREGLCPLSPTFADPVSGHGNFQYILVHSRITRTMPWLALDKDELRRSSLVYICSMTPGRQALCRSRFRIKPAAHQRNP